MTMSKFHRTRALSWAFVLGCSGLAPLAASAHDMKMDMGSESALGASAAFDAHGRLWLVSARGEHVVLQHVADPGTPLGTPVVVNAKPEAVYATGENGRRSSLARPARCTCSGRKARGGLGRRRALRTFQ